MKKKEIEGVLGYLTQVETVVNQIRRNIKTLPANRVVEKI